MKKGVEACEKLSESVFDSNRCKELLLVCGFIVFAIGCGTLYAMMEHNWALNSASRERVLIVAGLLFISSIVLCYFIIKKEQQKREVFEVGSRPELIYLMVDRPPSYDSVRETPPPSYQAVITGAYIIPCHKARP